MTAYIAYLRVSTQKQGQSGLGLEAQQETVARFLRPGDTVVQTFVEVESGKNDDRPQLSAALAACQRTGSKLLLARLDRLSRSVRFVSTLMESGTPFVAADMPHASDFELHIRAAVAQEERRLAQARTKAALAAARVRGVRLGGFRGRHLTPSERAAGTAKVNANKAAAARARALAVMPVIDQARAAGASTLSTIAAALNKRGLRTAQGGAWHPTQVQRVLRAASAV
jgi:DNA invertase Pin-like site-specific DNA recombinase